MFEIENESGGARAGVLKTAHAVVKTPFFMPVATKAVAKFIDAKDLESVKAQCIISNAFVLHLIPGDEHIRDLGGIHKFMNFNKGIFTDSGGFQMYSQKFLFARNKEGVIFSDPINGGKVNCTPEKDMQIQLNIGSDVAMCLDDMPKHGAGRSRIMDSVKKTYQWAKRCKEYHDKNNDKGQLLFGIAQGGLYPELRKVSARKISSLDFDGLAFGGLALGEPPEKMFEAVKIGMKEMPKEKIKYLMGVGVPEQIIEAVSNGIDCFDSRFATMNARHGRLFTRDKKENGFIIIDKEEFKKDERPIDGDCDCYVCRHFTRAYIHHLHKVREPTAKRYESIHNLRFLTKLMEDMRTAIKEGRFEDFKKEFKKES